MIEHWIEEQEDKERLRKQEAASYYFKNAKWVKLRIKQQEQYIATVDGPRAEELRANATAVLNDLRKRAARFLKAN